jgi:hypothetical protein
MKTHLRVAVEANVAGHIPNVMVSNIHEHGKQLHGQMDKDSKLHGKGLFSTGRIQGDGKETNEPMSLIIEIH